MKTRSDVETMLRRELDHWYPRQCENLYDDYYLWYLPTTAEHDGGIMIRSGAPAHPDYRLASAEKIHKDWTIDQNHAYFKCGLMRLPILEIDLEEGK